eukprot:2496660-Pleurochrysis_carterae.AAC.2
MARNHCIVDAGHHLHAFSEVPGAASYNVVYEVVRGYPSSLARLSAVAQGGGGGGMPSRAP